eukprot:COSAG03_NODE_27799_length_251_cov_0.671053_1_plen_60_part_01
MEEVPVCVLKLVTMVLSQYASTGLLCRVELLVRWMLSNTLSSQRHNERGGSTEYVHHPPA